MGQLEGIVLGEMHTRSDFFRDLEKLISTQFADTYRLLLIWTVDWEVIEVLLRWSSLVNEVRTEVPVEVGSEEVVYRK